MGDVSITIDKHQLQKVVDVLTEHKDRISKPNNGLDFILPNLRHRKSSDVLPVVIKNLTQIMDCANVIDVLTYRTNKVTNFTISGTTCTYLIGLMVGMDKHGMIKTGIF